LTGELLPGQKWLGTCRAVWWWLLEVGCRILGEFSSRKLCLSASGYYYIDRLSVF